MGRQGSHLRPGSTKHDDKLVSNAAVLDLPMVAAPATHEDDRLEQEILRLVEAARKGRLSERGKQSSLKASGEG